MNYDGPKSYASFNFFKCSKNGLDRLGRSLKKLLELVEAFKERGIHFQSLDDGIDTSTSVGNFFFQVIGAFSELERNLIVERTQKGLKAARSRGRLGGRSQIHKEDKKEIRVPRSHGK